MACWAAGSRCNDLQEVVMQIGLLAGVVGFTVALYGSSP